MVKFKLLLLAIYTNRFVAPSLGGSNCECCLFQMLSLLIISWFLRVSELVSLNGLFSPFQGHHGPQHIIKDLLLFHTYTVKADFLNFVSINVFTSDIYVL